MTPQPLVSIITIVFNGENHLEQTIQSVLNQTYPNIEYIIIDGGSKDSSPAIIKKYSKNLAYWVSEKDNGISDAFNKGIVQAKGEIIGIINADDWYELDAVEKIVNNIKDYDVAYGNLQYWKNNKKDMIVEGNDKLLLHEMTLNHPTVFIKRNCYEKFGIFDSNYKYAMDYDLLLRLKANDCKFVYINDILSNMRWEGLSDKQWYFACKEVNIIKDNYLPARKLINKIYFYKQVLSIVTGKLLEKINLKKTVRFYRKYLSPVRKRYV